VRRANKKPCALNVAPVNRLRLDISMKKFLALGTFALAVVVMLMVFLPSAWLHPNTYTVTLAGYNYTDRPISWYSIDDTGGGNVFVGLQDGGGKWACCARVTAGQPVHIEWRSSYTEVQHVQGIRPEEHQLDVIVPKPEGNKPPQYMEVHFYSTKHIELRLVPFPGKARWPVGTDLSTLDND
jgi:hypothetical protein